MNIKDFRAKYPSYNNVSDEALAKSLHSKYYPTVDFNKFNDAFIGKPALPTLPQMSFQDENVPQVSDIPAPKKWLTDKDFQPTFKQELLKPANVFGATFGTVGGALSGGTLNEPAAALGGEIGQGLEEFVKSKLPNAVNNYDEQAVKDRIRTAGKEQFAAELAGRAISPVAGRLVKPVATRLFGKAGTAVAQDIITKEGRDYAQKLVPAGIIRKAGQWVGGKFVPESITDAAKMQQKLISAGSRALPYEDASKVGLLPGDIMKNPTGSKLEGLASKGVGGRGISKQVTELNVPAYNQATKELVNEVGGIDTKLLNNRELGEDIYKVTKDRYLNVLKPKTEELYNIPQQTISKYGKTDVPALDISDIIDKNAKQVKESTLLGGIGSKGMGDDIAKKISKVLPSKKAGKEAQEVTEMLAKQQDVKTSIGMSKSELIKQVKDNPEALQSLIEQGFITKQDLVPRILQNAVEDLEPKKLTFGQYEKLRQRLVQEFDDVSNSITGDKNVLKKMAKDTIDGLDEVFANAAEKEGMPEVVEQIKYARDFFSKVQDVKNSPVIRNAWQLIEQQNQPETILNMLAQKDGLRTLQDAQKMMGKESANMTSKIKKSVFNGIINDPANQIEDLRLGIKTLNPKMAKRAFDDRFSDEVKKALFSKDELAKIDLHFKLGSAVGAERFMGTTSLGGAGMVVPLIQFGSSGGGGVVAGAMAGNVAGISAGTAIMLSPKAISYLSTGTTGQHIVKKIIELNSPKLSSASRSVLLDKFTSLIASHPSLAGQIRIINANQQAQQKESVKPIQMAGTK